MRALNTGASAGAGTPSQTRMSVTPNATSIVLEHSRRPVEETVSLTTDPLSVYSQINRGETYRVGLQRCQNLSDPTTTPDVIQKLHHTLSATR